MEYIYKIIDSLSAAHHKRIVRRMKKKYPDYEDDEYNNGCVKFLFGVRSDFENPLDDKPASFETINDIQLTYDRDTKLYSLELFISQYQDTDRDKQVELLNNCLKQLKNWMLENGYTTTTSIYLWLEEVIFGANYGGNMKYKRIQDLYEDFMIYVYGFEEYVRRKKECQC